MFIFAKIFWSMDKEKLTREQVMLARFAKALGHPVRIAILQMLAKQSCCYHGNMSELLPIAKSTLSQHLKELKAAGLIRGTISLPSIRYCIDESNWALARSLFDSLLVEVCNGEASCC